MSTKWFVGFSFFLVGGASESAFRSPWLIQAQSEDAPRAFYPVGKLRGAHPEAWEELSDELRDGPLPPALTRLIELSDLGSVLERVTEMSTGKSRWMPAGEPRDLRRLLVGSGSECGHP